MGKTKRQRKREAKRDPARAEEERLRQRRAERAVIRRKLFLGIWPIVVVAAAAAFYLGWERPTLAGILLFVGLLVWLAVALSDLGQGVKPRDPNRAGSIDFGR